ncbi:MAG: hypothetical protein Q9221_004832 [Calogaya cf. arnoldii]
MGVAAWELAKRGFTRTAVVAGAVACVLLCDGDDSSDNSGTTASAPAPVDPGAGPANPAQITCSADTNVGGILDHATNPQWSGAMDTCLRALSVPEWVGDHQCTPPTNDGSPSIKFYSKGENWDDQLDCYEKCSPCLSKGIQRLQAVSTWCRYEAHQPADGSYCELGFFY